jgi:hypothetical protein
LPRSQLLRKLPKMTRWQTLPNLRLEFLKLLAAIRTST